MSNPETTTPFATIEEAIEEIRQGKMVVVCDDEDRENEGDLIAAAQLVTPERINFMIRRAGGLICLALPPTVMLVRFIIPIAPYTLNHLRWPERSFQEHSQPEGTPH